MRALLAHLQAAVQAEGWPPPDGIRRQAQTFDRHVAPEIDERRQTASFCVDSLRYEMGRDLAEALTDFGATSVDGVATVLPTTTPCGMAALLPGADGALTLVEQRDGLVPALGGVPLPGRAERRGVLNARYGDRYFDLYMGDLLSMTRRQLASRIGVADLVVVHTRDIDAAGENLTLFQARKAMSEIIGDLHAAAARLAALGFQTLVFSADHGHILVPEIIPGDVMPPRPGDWVARKRRALLGRAHASAPGVLVLRTPHVGIQAPVADFAAEVDFKTFQDGPGYFHEGLSLQECIVPVILVRVTRPQVVLAASR